MNKKTSSLFAVQQPNLWVTPQTLKKYSHEGKTLESGTPLLTLEEACDHKKRVSQGHIQSAESNNFFILGKFDRILPTWIFVRCDDSICQET